MAVDASIRLRLDEALFILGIVSEAGDLRAPENLDITNSNLGLLLSHPQDEPSGAPDQEGLGAVLRLVWDHFQRPLASEAPAAIVPEAEPKEPEPEPPELEPEPKPEAKPEAPPSFEGGDSSLERSSTEPASTSEEASGAAASATEEQSVEGSGGGSAVANTEGLLHRVDPSFLSALPEDLRREVIADEVRSGLRQHLSLIHI